MAFIDCDEDAQQKPPYQDSRKTKQNKEKKPYKIHYHLQYSDEIALPTFSSINTFTNTNVLHFYCQQQLVNDRHKADW